MGEIRCPERRLRVVALEPGSEPPTLPADGVAALVVSMSGKAPPGARALSWEELDRWLAAQGDGYDPEGRTGFLIQQFRAFLPEAGITYFAGFDPADLDGVGGAFAQVSQFYQGAGALFERLSSGLSGRLSEVRQARPEDLLAGYCYRDYTGGRLGAANFLRIAIHLGAGQLQIACWLAGESSRRLREALLADGPLLAGLRGLEPGPLLWLWSAESERQIPLDELEPDQVAGLEWERYTVAVQVGHPLAELAGAGLVERIDGWVAALLSQLAPVLGGVLH